MESEAQKTLAVEFMERAFNQGDLSVIDEQSAPGAVDHQEPPGTDFVAHVKEVVTGMRAGFPDLHFEIEDVIVQGDVVAFRSTMTATHTGTLRMPHMPPLPPTGRSVNVKHMHFVRMVDGKTTDLWHVWDTLTMMRQLGVIPQLQGRPA